MTTSVPPSPPTAAPASGASTPPAPRLGFSAICEYLTASPTRQLSLLREQKNPNPAMVRGYRDAIVQVRNYAVNGTPLDPLAGNLSPHERDAINELIANGWVTPATATNPSTRQPKLYLSGVEISAYPDLLLEAPAPRGGGLRTGALKMYFPKTRDLDPGTGSEMATLLYYYLSVTLGQATAHPSLCQIYDARQDVTYSASARHARLLTNLNSAATMIAAIWPVI